jgi:hypothetical protein
MLQFQDQKERIVCSGHNLKSNFKLAWQSPFQEASICTRLDIAIRMIRKANSGSRSAKAEFLVLDR